MSKSEFQSFIKSQAASFDPSIYPIVKTVPGPNDKTFNLYDLDWYQNELNKFELFLEGDLMLGTIKISREYMVVKDQLADTDQFKGFDHFTYYTKIVDTSKDDSEIVASLGLIHGFI